MRLIEGRRLTGPNLLLDGAGVAVEVALDPDEAPKPARKQWRARVLALARKLDWPPPFFAYRRHHAGMTLAFTAPIDALNTAVDLAEWCLAPTEGESQIDAHQRVRNQADAEANPRLLALQTFARQHDLPWLWDEDEVSLGFGAHSQTWPCSALPAPDGLDPEAFRAHVPLFYVTGTNGKTTTARLLARMVTESGIVVGTTSTDGLEIGGVQVEAGDWTGGGGARKILRDKRIHAAVLEAARGGLLRRGLTTVRADAAIVTNVSDDHLGEWGIDTVTAMAEAKILIRKGLRQGGVLVLNAQCPELVAAAAELASPSDHHEVAWFAQDPEHPQLVEARGRGERMAYVRAGVLCLEWQGAVQPFVPVQDVPIAFGGMALHNIDNALAAVLAAGDVLPHDAIEAGLRGFRPTIADNPGRTNVFHRDGATLLVDFAHNPDGSRRLSGMLGHWPAQRRLVMVGQAGDRSDALIRELARAVLACRPDQVILKDALHYLRGRQPGEVPALLRRYLRSDGFPDHYIEIHDDEPQALAAALRWSQTDDLLVLLVHDDFPAAVQQLQEAGAVPEL